MHSNPSTEVLGYCQSSRLAGLYSDFLCKAPKRLEAVVGELGKVMNEADVDTLWYQTNLDVFLNRWYSNYEEARAARESNGGFLLPYKRHFFVCEAEVITAMGLAPDDPDWEKIKWDAAQPVDQEAYQRLCEKRAAIVTKDQLK